MADTNYNCSLLEPWLRETLRKIGLPARLGADSHIIKPSSLQIVSDHMNESIHALDLDPTLKKMLRESFAEALIGSRWLHDEREAHFINYHLPETIADLKICLAKGGGLMADDGHHYKWDSASDHPAHIQKAPTSRYMPTIYSELFNAFNCVLMNEGLPILERAHFRRAAALAARARHDCD